MRASRHGSAAAGLLALFSAASASASALGSVDLAECLNTKAATLAGLAACGHAGSIEYCLANRLPKESLLCTTEVLAQCFVNAGCQPDEALIEAAWTIKRCQRASSGVDGGSMEELRRRKPKDSDATTSKTSTKKTSTSTTSSSSSSSTSTSSSTPSSTSATSTPASTTSSPESTSEARRADSTFTGATTTSLVCFTTTTVSTTFCPVQSTGANAGKTTLSCFSTIALYPTCAAGLMCDTDSLGETTCMEKENNPGAAGIVIAIVFASGVVIAVTTMCFFCCRERRQHNRMAKAAEAAAIARQAAIDSKRPSAGVRNMSANNLQASSDVQPLMPPQHQYLPQSSSSSMLSNQDLRGTPSLHQSETSGDIATGPNPFADQHQLR